MGVSPREITAHAQQRWQERGGDVPLPMAFQRAERVREADHYVHGSEAHYDPVQDVVFVYRDNGVTTVLKRDFAANAALWTVIDRTFGGEA